MSVTVRLTDDLDVSRGDMICRPHNMPSVGQDIEAMVAWMTDQPKLRPGQLLAVKHTTRQVRAKVMDLQYRIDVTTLHRQEGVPESRAQRDRPGPAAHDPAAVLRRVPAQPHDRQLHPRRRGVGDHGGSRNDHPIVGTDMQFSGVFAFFWHSLTRTADQPVSGREAEIAQLESLYRGRGVPLTGAQVGVRLAALVSAGRTRHAGHRTGPDARLR